MIQLVSNIDSWSSNLGLLPLELNSRKQDSKYLLLGGGDGDFCIDTKAENIDLQDRFTQAWSSNIKNYVCVNGDTVHLLNWLDGTQETYDKKSIEGRFDKFYRYVASKSYKTNDDIIPFVLYQFRRMRNLSREINDPVVALNMFYHLLISLEDDIEHIDAKKWAVEGMALPSQFELYVTSLKEGVRNIKPNLDLILRHCSGSLFQEAHNTALAFDQGYDLFGTVSSNITYNKEKYTSTHYTPTYLARSVVESSLKALDLSKKEIRILDPACGSGTFLLEALHQLKSKHYQGKVCVTGWDCSDTAVRTTTFLLKYEQRVQWNEQSLCFDVKKVEDSLAMDWSAQGSYDVILMNPPFLSWELQTTQNRDLVSDILKGTVQIKRPNQASAFLYKAVSSISEFGVLGCVLPYSLLQSNAYRDFRGLVREKIDIEVAGALGNYVFDNALASTAVIVGKAKRETNLRSPICVWCGNKPNVAYEALRDLRKVQAKEIVFCDKITHSVYEPDRFPIIKDTWQTISYSNLKFLQGLEFKLKVGILTQLENVMAVHEGIVTGKKDVFIISQEDFLRLSLREKAFFRPLVDADSISDGRIYSTKYLWYPYDETGSALSDDVVLAHSWVKSYLSSLKEELGKRAIVNKWWKLTWPRPLLAKRQVRILSKRFGSAGCFVLDEIGDYVIEEGNYITLKDKFQYNDYYFYLAFFNSDIFETLLSIFAKPLKSGYDLGNVQIKNIPVPAINHIRDTKIYEEIVKIGKAISEGLDFDKYKIDDLLKWIYQK